MDFPEDPTPPAGPAWRRAGAAVAVLALALYAFLLAANVAAVAGASDSSGYLNHARLLGEGHLHVQPRRIPGLQGVSGAPMLYMPLGFRPAPDGNGMVPTYPVGLPLFILALKPLAGWRHAGDLTMVLHALGGVAAAFALARMLGLGRLWASLGAVVLAASPLYLFMSLQAMTDVPSLMWTTLAVLAALKSAVQPRWAILAGAAVAFDVLLRPANVLVLVPLAVAVGASPRRWILLMLGGVPGAAFFFAHSLAAYGSLAATGYGDVSSGFGARFVPGTLLHFAYWLPVLLTPLAALALGIPFLSSVAPRIRWFLAVWILAFAGFYAAYHCTHEAWWYLRFLLPAAPALLVAALLVLRAVLERAPAWGNPGKSPAAFAAALALVGVAFMRPYRTLGPLTIVQEELRYGRVTDWMQQRLPSDAVCVTMQVSGALFYSTQFTFVRWDALDRTAAEKVESAVRAAGRPLYAVLFPFEIRDGGVLRSVMPGRWIEVGKVEDVSILRRDFDDAKP